MLTLRKQAPGLRRDTFLKGARQVDREHKDVSWRHPLGHELTAADWHDGERARDRRADRSRVLGSAMEHPTDICCFCAMPATTPSTSRLPAPMTDAVWQIVFDTARWRANDLGNRIAAGENCVVAAHSCVLLADGDAPLSVRSGFSLT